MKKVYVVMEDEKDGNSYTMACHTTKAKALKSMRSRGKYRKLSLKRGRPGEPEYEDAAMVESEHVEVAYQANKDNEDQDELDKKANDENEFGWVGFYQVA